MYTRENTRKVKIGNIYIGGNSPITIQSMTNTKTKDIKATIKQIKELENRGLEIIRVAVLDHEDALAINEIKKEINIPLVADIHFNPDLAITSIKSGADKIRINPGNIEDKEKIKEIVKLCKERNIPIRIGINAGSLNKKYEHSIDSMMESAKENIALLEELDFYDIVLSFKSTNVLETIEAYKKAASLFPYPLHLGLTEAGPLLDSSIKSAIALGNILLDGIGDTIRISISGDPIDEIDVAKKILKNCNLRKEVPNLISCPTCGRIQYDMLPIVKEIDEYLKNINKDITVAIMGCPVNGPLEAKHADIGIAGGKDSAILFKKGEIVSTLKQEEIIDVLKKEINAFKNQH